MDGVRTGAFGMRAAGDRARWLAREILPHERSLRSWLGRRMPATDVDDIVQEAYAILVGIASVDHIQSPKNYLFQTARSLVLQRARRERVVRFEALGPSDFEAVSDSASPEDVSLLRDELRRADRLLAAMPCRVREAFMLRRVEALSQREIARRMQVSENTVEKHIGKALKIIMQAVSAQGDGGNAGLHVSTEEEDTRRRPNGGVTGNRRGSSGE
ncbi:RNA polymerase sigma factor [Brevundimonas sp. SORGH_AS_0993]|uniref:RNA polymerase sigma factor n=1 Tax=Brevundimonas sp. SORGH_AS_0993 TaxID=3041794 RepID=UPI0027D8CD45|nr:RNA polymerase sigma factor [Brevundimonas sp. SORGH_AS_0993]